MKKILFELYHGNIRPAEGTSLKEEEYQKAINQVCLIETALMSLLDETGQELYNQLNLALIARDNIEYAYIYADGFRTGANIMLACLLEGHDA